MTESEDNNSYRNVRPNTRRHSLLIETTARSPAKRQKTSLAKHRRRSVCSTEEPNLTFLEHFNNLDLNNVKSSNGETSYPKKKFFQSLNFQDQEETTFSTLSQLKEIASIGKLSRNSCINKNAAIEKFASPQNESSLNMCKDLHCENLRIGEFQSSSYIRRSSRNINANLDTCFVADYTDVFGGTQSASCSSRRPTRDSEANLDATIIADYTDAYGEVQSSSYSRKKSTRSTNAEKLDTGFVADNTDAYDEAESPSYFRKISTGSIDAKLNTSFVVEYSKKNAIGKRKERRFSGRFRRSLNTAFVEQIHANVKENIEPTEIIIENYSEPHTQITDSSISAIQTPTKFKLRNRTKMPPTEKEIIKYYTDKTIKKKKTLLETIFEPPDQKKVGTKKYKRFINFDERMSSSKIKKRHTKVIRYNLWENVKPLSMECFVERLGEAEVGF